MHKSVQWRMLTRTFTSRIMWNQSKLCTKTWEKQWCGAPGISSVHLCNITESQVAHRGDRVTTHRLSQPHWLPAHEGLLPGKDSWSTCLSSRRVQTGRHFSRLGMEYSISDCKKEPFSELGLAKRCRGTRSSWPLCWVLCALCSRAMISALWTGWGLFTKNSAQHWTSS